MHLWIFLNSGNEQKIYDELGFSEEENAILGYGGIYEIESEVGQSMEGYLMLIKEQRKENDKLEQENKILKNKLNMIKVNIDKIDKEQILEIIDNYTGFWGDPNDNSESEVN